MPLDAYLAQLSVIRTHDTTDRLGSHRRAHARARRRGGHPHPGPALAAPARRSSPAPSGRPTPAGTPACGSTPSRSTRPSSTSCPTRPRRKASADMHDPAIHAAPPPGAVLHPAGRARPSWPSPASPALLAARRVAGRHRRPAGGRARRSTPIVPGGTLVGALTGEPDTLDPATSVDLHRRPGLRQHLLQADRHRHRRRVLRRARHALERDRRRHAGSSTSCDNATFHNGEKFTADDVMYTFERILDPKTASAYAAAVRVDRLGRGHRSDAR